MSSLSVDDKTISGKWIGSLLLSYFAVRYNLRKRLRSVS